MLSAIIFSILECYYHISDRGQGRAGRVRWPLSTPTHLFLYQAEDQLTNVALDIPTVWLWSTQGYNQQQLHHSTSPLQQPAICWVSQSAPISLNMSTLRQSWVPALLSLALFAAVFSPVTAEPVYGDICKFGILSNGHRSVEQVTLHSFQTARKSRNVVI